MNLRATASTILIALLAVAGLKAADNVSPPSRYVQIRRDELRPGGLADYERLQMEKVGLLAGASWPRVVVALRTFAGDAMQVFNLTFYDSWTDWEGDMKRLDANPALKSKLASIEERQMAFLSGRRDIVGTYSDRMSYNAACDWSRMRYMSIITCQLKMGHGFEYAENRKIVSRAHVEAKLPENLIIYSAFCGGPSSTYYIMRPVDSLKAFDDLEEMHGAAYLKILGAEDQKREHYLVTQAVKTTEESYYAFDPRMSYVTAAWAGANGSFWEQQANDK